MLPLSSSGPRHGTRTSGGCNSANARAVTAVQEVTGTARGRAIAEQPARARFSTPRGALWVPPAVRAVSPVGTVPGGLGTSTGICGYDSGEGTVGGCGSRCTGARGLGKRIWPRNLAYRAATTVRDKRMRLCRCRRLQPLGRAHDRGPGAPDARQTCFQCSASARSWLRDALLLCQLWTGGEERKCVGLPGNEGVTHGERRLFSCQRLGN